ncbi:RNA polymerase factor sigma-32 [Commensalibacter intestini A911]|uniref:RNA polymerase sigma factor RpoH n=2 Tax=Commensalibacter intestini TaxID=479936 RepID=A0A251ZUY4_9PROT|nr:RNA polymerase sigma factor RpoH [Commensalibacter intestini]EHD13223.1 RNA polymerase factor sigma-32 [Commensalibacter intestini A911]OUI78474.1 RNA polymerase sigma 70 [Commensalibacter intestini]
MVSSMLQVTPDTNLTQYIQYTRKFPLLTLEQEQEYATKWKEKGDIEAAHNLVRAHLRLVVKVAAGYKGYGLPLNELISEGNIGMLQAIQRFDPEKGFRFTTYAIWWIKAAIQEYILHSWSLVKIGTTAAQKKLFFNLRRLKSQIKALGENDLNPEQLETISTSLGVSQEEVQNMNRRLSAHDHSLNASIGNDNEYDEWQSMLVDETTNQEETYAEEEEFSNRKTLLNEAMKSLKPREREILVERRLKDKPATLEELSQTYNISRERIRQIEVRAFEKLQELVQNTVMATQNNDLRRQAFA